MTSPSLIDCKSGNLQIGVGEFLVPLDLLLPIDLHAPDLARRIIAVEVRASELREFLSVIDNAAGERPKLGMRMFDRRWHVRCRAKLSSCIENVSAFVHTPAVVRTTLDQISLLPKILSVVADPNIASL